MYKNYVFCWHLCFTKFSFRKVVPISSYFQQHWVLLFFILANGRGKKIVYSFILHFFDYQWKKHLFVFISHLLVFFSALPIQTSCFFLLLSSSNFCSNFIRTYKYLNSLSYFAAIFPSLSFLSLYTMYFAT